MAETSTLYGEAFSYNQHSLKPLLDRVYPAVRARLHGFLDSDGRSVEELVKAIPKNTSELFRYGVLLRGIKAPRNQDDDKRRYSDERNEPMGLTRFRGRVRTWVSSGLLQLSPLVIDG